MTDFWRYSLDDQIEELERVGIDTDSVFSNNIVIGVSGRKGAGKTTLSDAILQHLTHEPLLYKMSANFADGIKEALNKLFCSAYGMGRNPVNVFSTMDSQTKERIRPILQDVGMGARERFSDDFWVLQVFNRIVSRTQHQLNGYGLTLIGDVRFQNEVAFLGRFKNSLLIHIEGGMSGDNHISEQFDPIEVEGVKVIKTDGELVRHSSQTVEQTIEWIRALLP